METRYGLDSLTNRDIKIKHKFIPSSYTGAGTDISDMLLDACGADVERYHEMYDSASSLFGYAADTCIPTFIRYAKGSYKKHHLMSNALFEIKVMMDLAGQYGPKGIKLRYPVYIKDKYNGGELRIATDIDISLPRMCVEVCTTHESILRPYKILTSKLHTIKWDFLLNPEKVSKRQRPKINDIETALLVVPGNVSFKRNKLRTLEDLHAFDNTQNILNTTKQELNAEGIEFEIYKTKEVWNGKKPMHPELNITSERLRELYKTNMNHITLNTAIELLGGVPEEILNTDGRNHVA